MIYYSGQLKDASFNIVKKRKGRKKKTVKRCMDIFTLDCEVSSAWMDQGGLIGYEPGHDADYWNDKDKFSLPYIWQFSFNDIVYYGRELFEFKKLLDDLPDAELIIWVHNLAYEFAVMLINILTVSKVFARSPHAPMYAVFEEHENITFRCSYILTNLSLATWGKQLGIKKLTGDLDYHILRTPKTELTAQELEYCERDCVIVYEGIKDHLKNYDDVFDIPMTSTGKIRRVVKDIVTNDKLYMKNIKRLIPRSVEEYQRFQSVFAGGYTHANRKYLNKLVTGDISHYDINSSYPTVMIAYKFPYNRWAYISTRLPDPAKFEDRAYISKLHFTGLKCKNWNTYISASKSRGRGIISDNGRVLVADELYCTVTEQDYITICNNYVWDSIESEGTWICNKKYLPTIFVKYILELYKDKTELKGVDPDRYAISKQYINSLFGMSVTNIIQSEVMYNDGEWDIGELTADNIEYKLNKMRRWFDKSYFLSYPAGCWITAYARRRLWECIEQIDNDLLYTDTDSVFYKGSHDWKWFNDDIDDRLRAACEHHGIDFDLTRPKDKNGVAWPLGYLSDEADNITQFKTLGAKKYIEGRTDGKLYMTVSGVNKAAVSCLNDDINNFCDGFVFDKDAPDMHKNEHVYITDMQPVTWPDGYKSDLKYGINMRPTGYKLSIPRIYDSLESFLNHAANPDISEVTRKRGKVI